MCKLYIGFAGLGAMLLSGCCGDPPEIPGVEQITRVEVDLYPWKGQRKAKFTLPESKHGPIRKWLVGLEGAKSQKYLAMGSLVIHTKKGAKISISLYSNPDEGTAIFEFNGNKCYYKAGNAKKLHRFLAETKSK